MSPMQRPSAAALTALLAAASCGGPSAEPADPTPVAPASTTSAKSDHRGAIGERQASVPRATNPRERVVFVRSGSIWMARADGSEPVQLTVPDPGRADESPVLSPDGRRVAYVSGSGDDDHRLVLMDLEELVPTELTRFELGAVAEPTWSPDGRTIAVMRGDHRDTRDLVLVPVDGGEPRTLVAGDDDAPELGGTPAWSPDGKTIALSADRRQGLGTLLWLVDADTGVMRQLTRGVPGATFYRDRFPSWTPDAQVLVFASNRHASSIDRRDDEEIYAIDTAGRQLIRLTEAPGWSSDPWVSPDGKRIYFTSTRKAGESYESEVYVMPRHGGPAIRLSGDRQPRNHSPSAGVLPGTPSPEPEPR